MKNTNSTQVYANTLKPENSLAQGHQQVKQQREGAGMLVVIDPKVEAYQMLAAGVKQGANVLILDHNQDGVEQITQALTLYPNPASLHIICHGAPGTLHLGKTPLNLANLERYSQQLQEWGVAEIFLYACNLAAVEALASSNPFLERLHQLTRANIAASAHRVGNALKGGQWHLEYQVGKVSSGTAFVPELMQAYPSVFPIIFGPSSLTTSEDGNTQSFAIVLSEVPTSTVVVLINNGDPSEGTVSQNFLLFDPSNWNVPQLVTVTGVDDTIDDGDITYNINIQSISADLNFNGSEVIEVTNLDNDLPPNLSIDDVTVDEAAGTATFTVTLDQASGQDVTVDFATNPGTALDGEDYTGSNGTLNIAAGETTAQITVDITDDAIDELDETFTVQLSNAVNATIDDAEGVATITDNDLPPNLSIDDVTVDEAAGTATFTVTLDQASGQDVTVDFATNPGTALDGEDYTGSNGTLNIAAGETTAQITVDITDDAIDELDETFTVQLSNAVNATIDDAEGVATITDNDLPPNLSIDDVTVDEAAGTATFTVTLDQASGQDVTVDFATNPGTALDGEDYTGSNGTLNIAAGETTAQITVDITDDAIDELDETFTVQLSNAVNATIDDAEGVATITDNDLPPNLSIDDVTVDEAAGTATFTVTLDQASGQDVTVDFATNPGTALDGEDYTGSNGTLNIAAGETTAQITVDITDDAIDELDETFTVQLSNAVNATIDDAEGVATITDNDLPPNLSIDDVTVDEAAGTATFTVTLDQASGQDVTVDFATNPGTALDGEDYTGSNGTLNIAAGETTAQITVDITDDAIDELDETFTVQLSNAVNATIDDAEGVATITDNDLPPNLSIDDVTVDEAAGTATFTVTLDQASGQDVTVDFATNPGTALDGEDYTGSNGTLNIAAGETTAQITVDITDDAIDELDETFTVQLSNAVNATIDDAEGVATITDNDLPPNLSIDDVTVDEAAGTATFTVTLDQASGQDVTVDFATNPGTALDGEDYTGSNGTLNIAAGETTAQITVDITDDAIDELDETFTVQLSNAVNATIDDAEGVATITDNDLPPNLSIDDVTVDEAAGTATFTVTLDQASGQDVTVDFATNPGTALDGEDYTGSNGTLNIAAGETTAQITVDITDDAIDELDETFTVQLSNAVNATIDDAEGVATITDNDLPPNLSIDDVTVDEAAGTATFTVTLDQASGQDVTVDFATNPGTALDGEDYTGSNGTLNIAAGETTAQITVDITDDAIDELDETFTVQLSNAVNATIDDAEGVATITDNDLPPNLSIDDVTVDEAAGTATFTVTLDQASGQDVTVDFATNPGTALDGEDYTGSNGTLNIAAGETTAQITVDITDDAIDELDETFTVQLSNAVNATIDDAEGVATITDNDLPPNLSIDDVTVDEAAGTATFTVTLDQASGQDVTVDFATNPGTALDGEDYTGSNGTLNIAAGETTAQITVDITDDAIDELDETFTVQLSNAVNATIDDAEGVATITDNDLPPNLSIDDVTVDEAAGTATFTVTLDQASGQDVTVDFATNPGTALDGEDYTGSNGTLNIAAGETTAQITVDITDDAIDELDETFTVQLSNAVNATIDDAEGVATITDNDLPPNLSIDDVTVDEAAGTATFTVTLDQASGQDVTVDFATNPGTALDGEDYTGSNGTLNIAAGETTAQITVDITDDAIDELDETFTVQLSNAVNATIDDAEGVATITDNDTAGISVVPTTELVTTEAGGTASFGVVLNSQPTSPVALILNSDDPTEGNISTNALIFDNSNWNLPQIVTVTGVDDDIADGDIAYNIVTSAISADANYNQLNVDDVALTNIDDDQAPFTLNKTPDDILSIEGGSGQAQLSFTLDSSSGIFVNEVGVFITDDQGRVNGISPESPEYLETVLNQSQVIFSGLSPYEKTGPSQWSPVGPWTNEPLTRQLGFDTGVSLGFYLVQNSTTDTLVIGNPLTGKTPANVFFTNASANPDGLDHLQASQNDASSFTLNWEDRLDFDFNDLVMTVSITETPPPIGTGLQGEIQGELIDLRNEPTGLLSADFVVNGTAEFDNNFGFYAVDDLSGSIGGIAISNPLYAETAISNRVDRTEGLPGGSLWAPYLIANGTEEEFLATNPNNQQGQLPQAYFSYLGANPDRADHIVRLADNTFGFEDRSDFDYNDLILQVNFT
ncbi:Calx-beta domain-containing protein [Lyngbya aestuarii]|uniref:Calx-beta domain-containing protein n=1 Tax=Lyngbya aestuarii TaxID=118322 RepID=UPI00403D7896